ncbi:hypothetical protein CS542_05185 [Pedobacter sp. IW39]|nr:hypothetical protein CS542_05185 [Pedobacter sp. IW39]
MGFRPYLFIVQRNLHALYNHPGKYHILNSDDASAGGEWLITSKVSSLESQPWKDYAGAWEKLGSRQQLQGRLVRGSKIN